MNKVMGLIGLALMCAAVLTAAPGTAQARIKCWTNNEGVRECGDKIPPEFAQKSHVEKSAAGVTMSRTKRARTQEELEAERLEVQRLAALREQEELAEREKAQRDRVLLATYTTEDDLTLARDSRLAAIDSRIRHTEQVLGKLETTLGELQTEAATAERSGKIVPADLLQEISSVQQQIVGTRRFVANRSDEKSKIIDLFAADLARWRQLKGR